MKRQLLPDRVSGIFAMGLDWFLWWLGMRASVNRALRQGLVMTPLEGEARYMKEFGLPFGMTPEDVAEYLTAREELDESGHLSAIRSGGELGLKMARMLARKSLLSADVVDFRQYKAMADRREEETG